MKYRIKLSFIFINWLLSYWTFSSSIKTVSFEISFTAYQTYFHKHEHLFWSASRLARTTLSLLHLRIRVSPTLVTINICKHASCEGKESLKTLLRRGFTQKEDKNKTNNRKLYPVVVTAVNEVAKRVKIHYVGIFGSLFVILAASLCAVELFLKFLWLGNFILQRFFYRSFLNS